MKLQNDLLMDEVSKKKRVVNFFYLIKNILIQSYLIILYVCKSLRICSTIFLTIATQALALNAIS